MIEVTQIRKSYGKKKVLSDITFQVKPGECVAIAGKNGCGKSTLMQIMAGILKPDGGELCYFGKKAAYKSSTFRRFCGYVPQENPLMEELTVQDNLKLWGGSHNANTKELVAQFQVEDLLQTEVSKLSGGMKQRVAIARAYAAEPEVLLMDEPFGALDAQTRTQLQTELLETWQREKKTCFFITHDVEEAIILAQTVIIMSARPGRIRDIVKIDIPYPRTQETKMTKEFMELKNEIWSQVYQEYLEVRK